MIIQTTQQMNTKAAVFIKPKIKTEISIGTINQNIDHIITYNQ